MKLQKILRDNCTSKEESRATFQTPVQYLSSSTELRHSSPKAPLLSSLAWPFPPPVTDASHHFPGVETRLTARQCDPVQPQEPPGTLRPFPQTPGTPGWGFFPATAPSSVPPGRGEAPLPPQAHRCGSPPGPCRSRSPGSPARRSRPAGQGSTALSGCGGAGAGRAAPARGCPPSPRRTLPARPPAWCWGCAAPRAAG